MSRTRKNEEIHPTFHRSGSSSGGLTKREKFALEIMRSLAESRELENRDDSKDAARMAAMAADDLIRELNK